MKGGNRSIISKRIGDRPRAPERRPGWRFPARANACRQRVLPCRRDRGPAPLALDLARGDHGVALGAMDSLLGRRDPTIQLGRQANNIGSAQPRPLPAPGHGSQADVLAVVLDDKTLIPKRSLQIFPDIRSGGLALRCALLRGRGGRLPRLAGAGGNGGSRVLTVGCRCQEMPEAHPGIRRRLAGDGRLGSCIVVGGSHVLPALAADHHSALAARDGKHVDEATAMGAYLGDGWRFGIGHEAPAQPNLSHP